MTEVHTKKDLKSSVQRLIMTKTKLKDVCNLLLSKDFMTAEAADHQCRRIPRRNAESL